MIIGLGTDLIAAARAGKHIIIEKPIALSSRDCAAIAEAVKKAKVKTCVCFECRYSSQFLATKALIDAGLLGELHYGEVDYYHGIGPWYGQFRWNTRKDAGGSSLLTAGCHALDALLLCLGDDVAEVTSYDTKSRSKIFEPYEYTTSSVTIEANGGESVVLTLGPADAIAQLRDAMALGIDRAIHLETGGEEWDAEATANAILEAIRTDEAASGPFDLIMFGNEAADTGGYQVGLRVAYALGRPAVRGAKGIAVSGGRARIEQAILQAPTDAVRRAGDQYLTELTAYEAEATQAGASFVEIQHTMLFATVGQNAE